METRKAIACCLLIPGVLLLLIGYIPRTESIDIPVNATVLNSPPQILAFECEESVDPNTFFRVRVRAGDNNTLADILWIRLVMKSLAEEIVAYQFIWDDLGFRVYERPGQGPLGHCEEPNDMKKSNGTWVFVIKLPGEVPAGPWELSAIVSDEEDTSEDTLLLWINSFISITLPEPSKLNLSVPPGSIADGSRTVLHLCYTSNENVDLLARTTTFVGAIDPSFELPPSAFHMWVDKGDLLELSEDPKMIAGNLPGGKNKAVQVLLSVEIPQPFYDQEYEGIITIILSPTG